MKGYLAPSWRRFARRQNVIYPFAYVIGLFYALCCACVYAQAERYPSALKSVAEESHPVLSDLDRLSRRVENAIADLNSELEVSPDSAVAKQSLNAQRRGANLLEGARADVEAANEVRRFVTVAPMQLVKLKTRLDNLRERDATASTDETGELENESADAVETHLRGLRFELGLLEDEKVELERELTETASLPAVARVELSKLRRKAVDSLVRINPAIVTDADRLFTEVADLARRARIDLLEQQVLAVTPRSEVLKLRRDISEHGRRSIVRRVAAVDKALSKKLRDSARSVDDQVEIAEELAINKHPVVKEISSENSRYADILLRVTQRDTSARMSLDRISTRKQKQFDSFKSVRDRINVAGTSGAVGEFLNQKRKAMPGTIEQRYDVAQRRAQIEDVTVDHFDIVDRLNEITDPEEFIELLFQQNSDSPLSGSDRSDLVREIGQQRNVLEQLDSRYTRFLDTLSAVEFEAREYERESTEFRRFLDDRLLWTRNAAPMGWQSSVKLRSELNGFLNFARFSSLVAAVRQILRTNIVILIVLVVGVSYLWSYRRHFLNAIYRTTQEIASAQTDHFIHTVKALLLTVALSLPWPLVFLIAGGFLGLSSAPDAFPGAIGKGLLTTAPILFVILFLLNLCRPSGVAVGHFRWPAPATAFLVRHLRWFLVVYLGARFTWAFAEIIAEAASSIEIGRVAAFVALSSLAWFLYRVAAPGRPLLAPILSRGSRVWTKQLSFIWFPLLVVTPLVMVILVSFGYLYTTREILIRLEHTLALFAASIVFEALLIRALNVAQRRLALKRAKERWEARVQTDVETSAEGAPVTLSETEVDIATVDSQSRQFIRTIFTWTVIIGIWLIWSDMLGFFGEVTDVELWRDSDPVNGESEVAVNLRDIIFAALVGLLAWIAARNLPGVLEISLLQRLALETGSRYAIGRIAQYAIGGFGIVYVLFSLGIRWSEIQWLVAALSVGIGFGLQEIFANFMSGLILLFERPVRIGDTITIGELSGTVSRIRLRTTTIVDWDNKEIVLPNKDLITDRLVNWTLSDQITRVVIPFGVAYGTDVETAYRLVEDIAKNHPKVLSNPPFQLFLLELGDSSLNFELRVFVSQLVDRLPVTHDLIKDIERTMNEQDIEIPFPQRDLHLRGDYGVMAAPS